MLTATLIGATRNAWGYLMASVSTEHAIDRATDRASYYMAGGTPPGAWAGRGAVALGLTNEKDVTEDQLRQLFGDGKHPITGEQLGKQFRVPRTFEERLTAKMAAAALDPAYAGLPAAEFEALESTFIDELLAEPEPQSVAGFEFVFSPQKSVSSWWALADPTLKDEIRKAHHAAIAATIEKLEKDIIRTRTGTDGVAQEHVQGITAALFDHWDSRDGDPQLHTHMLVSNRVQGIDGAWRTIDSRWSLMPAVAAAGAFYDGVLMDELSNRFGVDWTVEEVLADPVKYQQWLTAERLRDSPAVRHQYALDHGASPGSVKWQIVGIPDTLSKEYSTRARAIEKEKNRLIRDYEKRHGRKPDSATIIQMRQQATLCTRQKKKHRTLRELTTSWRDRARNLVGDSFMFADRIVMAGQERKRDLPLWTFRHDDISDESIENAAATTLAVLGETRATWGYRNAEANALRAIASWRFRSPADRDATVKRIVATVLGRAVALTPKNELHTPYRFRTADGDDVFHPITRDLYTTQDVWDAEERLLEAGRATDGARVSQELVDALIATPTGAEGRILSDDQAAAVANVVLSGRSVDVLVGPAGAGKTTSLEKLREIWEREHGEGKVRGLAPTARAAEVLAESLGIQTENTAKWLYETARDTEEDGGFNYTLTAGDLVIVDEASIAGTVALDRLRAQADEVGAKLLLVGDWAQLAAVDAGGAFGLLATDRHDVAELVNLHRFTEDWEADASKLLRLGKTSGLDPYIQHGRISAGFDETIVRDAVNAWKEDEATVALDGDRTLVSLLIASTNDMVERLNDIAREWRIETGHVDATRQTVIQSGVASPGDRIVTRENNRQLFTDHDRWVKNNDEWVVVDVTATGDIVASSGDERVTLPAEYCREHVQLAYATTAHRSQGRTVDTAHTIVDSATSRETFYVAMTRGKQSNCAYVVVDEHGATGDNASTAMSRGWRETLDHVVMKRGGDISAHDTLRDESERIGSVRQLVAEYQTIQAELPDNPLIDVLSKAGIPEDVLEASPARGATLSGLYRLQLAGHDPEDVVKDLLGERELSLASDMLSVLHYRLERFLESHNIPPTGDGLIAGLVIAAPPTEDSDLARALRDRELAIELRAEFYVDQAIANEDPWLQELGPMMQGGESDWRRRAVTVACYRDLYGVTTVEAVGQRVLDSRNRERDRKLAAAALQPVQETTPHPQTQTATSAVSPAPAQATPTIS